MNEFFGFEGEIGHYLLNIFDSKPLSHEEERELSRRIQAGDEQARNKLVEANLRFVVSVAKLYQKQDLSLEDLIQSGNVGLIIAADRFDGEKGFKFISYAVWWIRQAIMLALAEQSRTIRLPISRISLLISIRKALEKLNGADHEPTTREIADEIGTKEENILDIISVSVRPKSTDAYLVEEEGKSTLLDLIPDETQETDAVALESDKEEMVAEVLQDLDPREAKILRMFFGFDGKDPMSLEEIGKIIGVTRERTRQLKERALNKIRYSPKRESLRTLLPEYELG